MGGNWKDICKTKNLLKYGYSHGVWLADLKGYTVSSGYEWLRKKEHKVGWATLVWNPWCLPKHCFLNWLMFRSALPLKDRLLRHRVSLDDQCCICCNSTESMLHLFQHCRYVSTILELISAKLHIPIPKGNAIIWIGRRHWSRGETVVCLFAFMAVYYNVWQQRNLARLEGLIAHPEYVVAQIFKVLQIRVRQCNNIFTSANRVWLNSIGL
ncbi:uncharacterized protein LOC141632676 [Silene latifolia]|uniref:uncharacterized protein LOC141632676 n=1 Tax=Silene latifolia TaxID=37657 RepID=UPI003D77062D